MRLFIFFFLISYNALAITWSDLERGSQYTLGQNFQLPQKERSGSMLDFSKGDKMVLKEKSGMLGMVLFNFYYRKCPGNQMETDVEIIPVKGTPVEIGATAQPDCELWIYVENKDYWTESFFN